MFLPGWMAPHTDLHISEKEIVVWYHKSIIKQASPEIKSGNFLASIFWILDVSFVSAFPNTTSSKQKDSITSLPGNQRKARLEILESIMSWMESFFSDLMMRDPVVFASDRKQICTFNWIMRKFINQRRSLQSEQKYFSRLKTTHA